MPLKISVFNRDVHFEAKMVNCSLEGVCAETRQPIRPKTSLFLRIDSSTAGDLQNLNFPGLRTSALGEVKWCDSQGDPASPRYLVGIRYYAHY